MAATGQAAAAGDGQGQAQGGDAAQASGFDAQALQAQLQTTSSGVDELRQQFGQFIESAPWQAQQQADDGQQQQPGADIDLAFLDDPTLDNAGLQQHFGAMIQQAAQAQIAQALGPVQEQQAQFRREQQARDLIGEYPEFQDPKVAERIAGPKGLAVQLAQDLGMPQLAVEPSFWRLVHMADRGAASANAETGAESPTAAHLEGSGGANPGGAGQVDLASQIMNAGGGGKSVLPFA